MSSIALMPVKRTVLVRPASVTRIVSPSAMKLARASWNVQTGVRAPSVQGPRSAEALPGASVAASSAPASAVGPLRIGGG